MLTQEEIRIKAGLDYSKVESGMKSMASKVAGACRQIAGSFAGMFAAGAVIGQFKKVIDSIEQMTQRAEALGVPVQFMQDIENVGRAAGKSSQQIQQMMSKFTLGLEEGQDAKAEFLKFLDAIKNTEDPVMRTKLAFDRLGKSGLVLLDFAKDGSKGFEELAKTFTKFSDEQIIQLQRADAEIDKWQNKWTIFLGGILALATETYSALGKVIEIGEFGSAKQFKQALKERLEAEANIKRQEQKKQSQDKAKATNPDAYNPTGGENVGAGGSEPADFGVIDFLESMKGNMRKAQNVKSIAAAKADAKRDPVARYYEKVNASRLKWQAHVDRINGKAPAKEPMQAPGEPPIRVSIVEVKE